MPRREDRCVCQPLELKMYFPKPVSCRMLRSNKWAGKWESLFLMFFLSRRVEEKGKEGLNTHCWERQHRLSSNHRGIYPFNAACPRAVVIYISKHATFPELKTSQAISCNSASRTCFSEGAEAAAIGASHAHSPHNSFLTPEIRSSGLRVDPSLQKTQGSLDIQGWHQGGWN